MKEELRLAAKEKASREQEAMNKAKAIKRKAAEGELQSLINRKLDDHVARKAAAKAAAEKQSD